MTEPDTSRHPRTARFRALKADIGLSLPALATALGRPLGTLTGYTHSGSGSCVPSQAVLEEMEALLISKTRRIAADRGCRLVWKYDDVDQVVEPQFCIIPNGMVLSSWVREVTTAADHDPK